MTTEPFSVDTSLPATTLQVTYKPQLLWVSHYDDLIALAKALMGYVEPGMMR